MQKQVQMGKNSEDIQEMNRSLVIRLLLENNANSRIELSKLSGLNQATITNIIKDFIGWGLAKETGMLYGSKGRRSIGLELEKDKYKIICARLTRKYYSVAVFDLAQTAYEKETCEIESFSRPDSILSDLAEKILIYKKKYARDVLLGVGLALPGPFEREHGEIILMTESEGWHGINVPKRLQDLVGMKVLTEHDANAATLAEWRLLEGEERFTPMMCIMLGQGIGAGVTENGAIIHGKLGTAGEIGHMSIQYDGPKCECGNRGCLEMYSSTYAIKRDVQRELDALPSNGLTMDSRTADIIEAYKMGDELAVRVINRAARYLGYGIVNLLNVLNPGIIVIGDELSKAGQPFLDAVTKEVKARVLPELFENTEIRLSGYSEDATMVGASILVVEDAIRHPEVFIRHHSTS